MPGGKLSKDGREDARLVKQCRRGDVEAFSALVGRYQDGVYCTVYRMVGEREQALDLTQEAFVRAFEGIEGFDLGMPFKSWIYRIATNAAIDYLRKGTRTRELPLDAGSPARGSDGDGEGVVIQLRGPESELPEKVTERRESAELVYSALAELPGNYKAAIVLHHLEGMAYSEVASILGVPRNTAKTWAHRGRLMLCESLEGVVINE